MVDMAMLVLEELWRHPEGLTTEQIGGAIDQGGYHLYMILRRLTNEGLLAVQGDTGAGEHWLSATLPPVSVSATNADNRGSPKRQHTTRRAQACTKT